MLASSVLPEFVDIHGHNIEVVRIPNLSVNGFPCRSRIHRREKRIFLNASIPLEDQVAVLGRAILRYASVEIPCVGDVD